MVSNLQLQVSSTKSNKILLSPYGLLVTQFDHLPLNQLSSTCNDHLALHIFLLKPDWLMIVLIVVNIFEGYKAVTSKREKSKGIVSSTCTAEPSSGFIIGRQRSKKRKEQPIINFIDLQGSYIWNPSFTV